jgi:hypothetical protein
LSGLYGPRPRPYIVRHKLGIPMGAETDRSIEEIQQAIALLRRHL